MITFTRSVDLLQRAMSVNSLRYQVTANNISNAETPNFKRQEVNFESELKKALDSEKDEKSLTLAVNDDRHIQISSVRDFRDVQPRRTVDWSSSTNANGSNVDAESEAMNIMKIQLNYRLLAQLENFEFSQLRTAMKK